MKLFNLKLNKKLIIIINLFLITALMTVSVYAWFASHVDNRVDAYEITVESNNALELSFDGNSWGGALNLADYKDANGDSILKKIKFVEITGDGTEANFQVPQLSQKTNYAEPNTAVAWSPAYQNQDYLVFTVLMRSKDKMNVYLSSDSLASPASSVLTGENCGNASTYASGANAFSKDCVVGALRVGFTNQAGAKHVWITNPEFHLNNTVGSEIYTMDTDATNSTYSDGTGVEPGNFIWNQPNVHYYYDKNKTLKDSLDNDVNFNALSALPDTVTSNPGINSSTHIATLDGTPDSNGYYKDSVKFVVWIEGCDTEARRALVDGSFNLSFVFDTYGVE